MSVPTCSATSNVLLSESFDVSSVHPNSSGTMIRCPLDEMGRNSDSPWKIPRMIACSTGKQRRLGVARVLGRHQREGDDPVRLGVGERGSLVGIDEQRDAGRARATGAGTAASVGGED